MSITALKHPSQAHPAGSAPTDAERCRHLWHLLDGTATEAPPADAPTISERLVRGVRMFGQVGTQELIRPLDEFAALLPKPLARLDAISELAGVKGNEGFEITGDTLAAMDRGSYYYVQSAIGKKVVIRAASANGHEAMAFLLVGKAHYRAGIPARIAFSRQGEARAFEIGIGAEWMVSTPPFNAQQLKTVHDRVFIVILEGASFEVYCDGLKVARGTLPDGGSWNGVSISVAPHLAPSGDLIIYRSAVWGLERSGAQRLRAVLDVPGAALSETLVEDGDAAGLSRLLRADDRVAAETSPQSEQRILEQVGQLIALRQEYLAETLAKRLDPRIGSQVQSLLTKAGSDPIVKAENLVVELEINPERERRLARRLTRKRDVFRAVDGVNFALNHGDVLGIIGHNGAGKSTLLRALCGLIDIREGRITIADRFLLLRPGMGMRDELTGRENIYSMGFYLGLELGDVRALVDDIIDFSELGSHIDKAVKYYSDGMRARLSFSIATSFAPEVLFLDELLGAGDISFQEKAQARLRSFIKSVGTVVVVTHAMQFVTESCTKALLMHGGRQVYFGDPQEAVARFMFLMES